MIKILLTAMMLSGGTSSLFADVGKSKVYKVVDPQENVVCYVIPQSHCVGDCAYSPAISCVKR